MKKLFVGNISRTVTEAELRELFLTVGEVIEVVVITHRNMTPRGFGFVEMSTEGEARKAIEEINGRDLQGRALVVMEARERSMRSGGMRPNRGRGERGKDNSPADSNGDAGEPRQTRRRDR